MGVRRYSVSQLANRFAWVSGMALGRLVVPEVNRIMAVRSGSFLPESGQASARPSRIRAGRVSSMQNQSVSGSCAFSSFSRSICVREQKTAETGRTDRVFFRSYAVHSLSTGTQVPT